MRCQIIIIKGEENFWDWQVFFGERQIEKDIPQKDGVMLFPLNPCREILLSALMSIGDEFGLGVSPLECFVPKNLRGAIWTADV